MNWFRDLFSESSDVSMTRFLSFLCVVSAVLIAVVGVIRSQDVTGIVATFLGAGLTAKVTQRFAEASEASKESENEKV